MKKIEPKKIMFTLLAWLLEGYALGMFLFMYLVFKSFLWPGEESYSELLIMLTIAILATLLRKWIDKRYSSVIVSGHPRKIWQYCCFAVLLMAILIYVAKHFYDQRQVNVEFIIIVFAVFLLALYAKWFKKRGSLL
jgi:hypothetical protein